MQESIYIQVCLPLRLPWEPWYSTTDGGIHVGQRVAVHFARRAYTAVVISVGGSPDVDRVFPIDYVETSMPDITDKELQLWRFVASYYMCTLGEVHKLAYPGGKRNSERITATELERAAKKEEKLRLSLESKLAKLQTRLRSRQDALGKKHSEAVSERLRNEAEALQEQIKAVRESLDALGVNKDAPSRRSRISFREKPGLLLGTERTAVYIKEIRVCLNDGGQVLVLACENDYALNLHTALKKEFGDKVHLFTSETAAGERRRALNAARGEEACIIVGTRSSVFLPHSSLGLVIVDEEQDPSFKQREHPPLYNGRDTAAMLAKIHGARLLLGSACPSLESLHNCLTGKYELLRNDGQMAAGGVTSIIDINEEKKKRGMVGAFSRKALELVRRLPAAATISIIRCYIDEDEAESRARELLGDRSFRIFTPAAARKTEIYSDLSLILNADVLFDRNDFRADEKALQVMYAIACRCHSLVVQCSSSALPVYEVLRQLRMCHGNEFTKPMLALLEERRSFKLPPYTKVVDVRSSGMTVSREVLTKDSSLPEQKKRLRERWGDRYVFDVDPL